MTFVLLAVGLGLIVFGGIVLLRFSDRPGGSLKWLGMELSSTGAGLPLVGLGIGCLLVAVASDPGGGRSDAAGGGADTALTRVAPTGSGPVSEGVPSGGGIEGCLAAFFESLPGDRVARIEAGMRDVQVIGAHQPLEPPFGLLLTDGGEPVAALRIRLYRAADASADLYRIEAVVNTACEPVEQLRNSSRGGSPTELVNWDTLRMRLGETEYELRIGGEGDIGVGYFRRQAE